MNWKKNTPFGFLFGEEVGVDEQLKGRVLHGLFLFGGGGEGKKTKMADLSVIFFLLLGIRICFSFSLRTD